MSKGHVEVDCTRQCKSRCHGQALSSAITKRSVSDESLGSFIRATCSNFSRAFDDEGRTALHMAASCGRCKLMEWLVRHSSEAFVNARDRESGYTPLHRSIFYGQIHDAVALMKIGINPDIVDKDDYKALEHAMLDRHYMYKETQQPCDVYVWGSNSNYTLGTGTQQQKKVPDLLNCFSRTNTSVDQVCLGKFHSAWLCSGAAWVCGQLARCGAPVATSLQPRLLRLPEPCARIALTHTSTVLLLQSGAVLQYSLSNTDNAISQSNTKTPSIIKLPPAKPLLKLAAPLGVAASRHHACVWNVRAVYTWGTNAGQLGHPQQEKVVDAPKRVALSMNSEETDIQLVSAADAATVITTSRGDVYLLHKYLCKKIAIKQINLRQVCVDAKVSEQGAFSRVTVLLLTNVGQLLIWQDTTNKLTRCVFGLNHQTVVTHASLTHDAMFFTTRHGEAFVGHISRGMPVTSHAPRRDKDTNKSALVKFLEKDDCTSVRLTRIPNIHRAVSIEVDGEGINFACLQMKPTSGLKSLPHLSPSSMSKQMSSLLETVSEDDLLHDVVFRIGTKRYPAHMFIVGSSSPLLNQQYQDKRAKHSNDVAEIVLENVLPEVFERILRFVYTGSCDVMEAGPCGLKVLREDVMTDAKKEAGDDALDDDVIENPLATSAYAVHKLQGKRGRRSRGAGDGPSPPRALHCDPVRLLQAAAKRLQIAALHKTLMHYYYRDGFICQKETACAEARSPPTWERDSMLELADTRVRSKDGASVTSHKCVLAARLDYFHGMFMHSWTESKQQSTVSLPINYNILLPVINFLYTDSCPEVESSESLDFICSLLIVADQLFITRLREMCEAALANMITLKNCAELCQFAHTYNSKQLKECCMQFISLNMCSILENRTLESLDERLLEDISKYYCKFNPIMSSRVITPFYNAPTDDVIDEVHKNCPVDLDATDEHLKNFEKEESAKRKRSTKKIEYTESEKARKRYESVSSSHDTSGDITLSLSKISKETETPKKPNKWIEVPTSQQKIQSRIKAITTARDILNEPLTENFVTLTKTSSNTAISSSPGQESPWSSRMSVSPKDSPLAELARSPQGSLSISHVGPKLSQKQRKKLAMQGETPGPSLDEFVSNKLTRLSVNPDKPKNPWKTCEAPITSYSSAGRPKAPEFNQILADQKKQKDDSSRIMTKPLLLTQLEDKAIEELERFYNIHEIDDELISVRRIELQVSSPQWIHTAPKL